MKAFNRLSGDSMERFDVAVVGAGPAGSSAAYTLAKRGCDVLLVERGNVPGQKNMFGGRIYSYPLQRLMGDDWREAPIERFVTRENLVFLDEDSAVSLQYDSPGTVESPAPSFTALRGSFDRWLAQKAEDAGAMLITGIKVDELWREDGSVRGVVAGRDRVQADLVIAADGALSLMAKSAGLRGDMRSGEVSVGVKETVELSEKLVEERFNLGEAEGAAYVFAGYATGWIPGGGFLYTNRSTLSLGIVAKAQAVSLQRLEVQDLMEAFKLHPVIQRLVRGGKVVEYSAHLIPDMGIRMMPRAYGDGVLVAGDAAGFLLNNGYTFRGVDLAIVSGIAAAETYEAAREAGDFSAAALRTYEDRLRQYAVLEDLVTFRRAPDFLKNPRLYSSYPRLLCNLMERIYTVDGRPKDKVACALLKEASKTISLRGAIADLVTGAFTM
jgi:electron transfer flavoprotein-quinone oxidoreductase